MDYDAHNGLHDKGNTMAIRNRQRLIEAAYVVALRRERRLRLIRLVFGCGILLAGLWGAGEVFLYTIRSV